MEAGYEEKNGRKNVTIFGLPHDGVPPHLVCRWESLPRMLLLVAVHNMLARLFTLVLGYSHLNPPYLPLVP